MTIVRFAACTVHIIDSPRYMRGLVTVFHDGTTVEATPNHDPDSIQRAHDLGYHGDTWAMSRDHELAHSWLARPHPSPVLWGLAHPDQMPAAAEVDAEEGRVLEWQRQLDKAAPRPWDITARTKETTP